MSNIKFVSHESFPDDQYTKELVYLCLDDKYRVAYVRRQAKNGGLFWGGATVAVNKGGIKEYYDAFMADSTFLNKDVKLFLEERSWEVKKPVVSNVNNPLGLASIPLDDSDLPF